MSHEASNYAKKLGRDQVTRRQKLLLMVLADYHNTARRAAWPSLPTLAEESLMDTRECRRVLKELEVAGILERLPGRGQGNYSEYRFPEIDGKQGHIAPFCNSRKGGQKEGEKGGQKEGQVRHAIRKEPEPKPEHTPPTPRAGGFNRLNARDRRRVASELQNIYRARAGCYEDTESFEQIVMGVSARLVLSPDEVRSAINESYGVTRDSP